MFLTHWSVRRPFIGHHYYNILSLSDLCLGIEKILNEIHQFIHFLPQNYPPPLLGVGVIKFTICCILTLQMLIWLRLAQYILRRRC